MTTAPITNTTPPTYGLTGIAWSPRTAEQLCAYTACRCA